MKFHEWLYELAHKAHERYEKKHDGCVHEWVTTIAGGCSATKCSKCGKDGGRVWHD